jgi:hypothetical protein
MTKKLLTFVSVLCATVSFAQQKGSFEMGAGIGFSGSNVYGDNFDPEVRNGFNAALSGEYYFSGTWGLKTKVTYDRKGYDQVPFQHGAYVYATNYSMDYITIPVMANWHFGRTKNWYLNFGPYVGFLVASKEEGFDTPTTGMYNKTDAGLAYGIGVKIPVGSFIKIFIEFEGQGGMSDVFKDSDMFYRNTTTSRVSFNTGVNFLLQ